MLMVREHGNTPPRRREPRARGVGRVVIAREWLSPLEKYAVYGAIFFGFDEDPRVIGLDPPPPPPMKLFAVG